MSKDEYPSKCLRQMEAILFIILETFSQRNGKHWKTNITRVFRRFSCCIFSHVTRLNQSRESENIRILIGPIGSLRSVQWAPEGVFTIVD